MHIVPVDDQNNLYTIEDIFPPHIVTQVLNTNWIDMPWQRQEGQELWSRRRIDNSALPWMNEYEAHLESVWHEIAQSIGRKIKNYQGTAWWLDEPGFTCALHTDGEMPGSMQINWFGESETGTTFYHHKDSTAVRYQMPMKLNSGYIMINTPDATGYRKLQWHGMLTPVHAYALRLTSYSWITEIT